MTLRKILIKKLGFASVALAVSLLAGNAIAAENVG
ncbi:MAG: hypothetical protein ACI9AP_001085, partial [Flavobacteriales bacterium]